MLVASKRFLARLSMGFSVLDGIFNVPKDLLTFFFGTPSFPHPINNNKKKLKAPLPGDISLCSNHGTCQVLELPFLSPAEARNKSSRKKSAAYEIEKINGEHLDTGHPGTASMGVKNSPVLFCG